MKVLRWLRRHWYVPLVAIFGLAAFVLGRGSGRNPVRRVKDELEAIKAGERAQLVAADRGLDAANAQVEAEHRATMASLDVEQRAKADRLRADPAARARWLTRLAKGG